MVLGMLPLARELVKLGSSVVLAANAEPTINDITAAELAALLEEIRGIGDKVRACVLGCGCVGEGLSRA